MKPRDLELLSAYLDGQLAPTDLARMEARLGNETALRQELENLRSTRDLLHKLPSRRAPRDFVLTRTMVGRRPPEPRTVPVFRFASAAAAFLLVMTFALNALVPRIGMGAAAPAYGMGGGGGEPFSTDMYEAPALQEPVPAEPLGTPAPESFRAMPPTPEPKVGQEDSLMTSEAVSKPTPAVSPDWQVAIAIAAVGFSLAASGLRWAAARRWRN